ncbi:hypothetical protein CEXT_488471, partial [Caerostris extrusa]
DTSLRGDGKQYSVKEPLAPVTLWNSIFIYVSFDTDSCAQEVGDTIYLLNFQGVDYLHVEQWRRSFVSSQQLVYCQHLETEVGQSKCDVFFWGTRR